MGLGKTVQMLGITLLNPKKHTLIVCPVALMEQWAAQTRRFLGHDAYVFHGVASFTKDGIERLSSSPIIITSYSTMVARASAISAIHWNRVIFDEAHYLRNSNTAMFMTAFSLNIDHCWLVTGTPLQNRISDLRSLCTILGLDVDTTSADQFQDLLPHIMLRRTKESAGIVLPPLTYHNVHVPWSNPIEARIARDLHSLISFSLVDVDNVDAVINLLASSNLSAILRMRQICTLPSLLGPSVIKHLRDIDDSSIRQNYGRLLQAHSKMNAVVDTIRSNIGSDHRAMIFCNFRAEMDFLHSNISRLGLSVGRIDGSTTPDERVKLLAAGEDSPRVLILQVQTACEGLNLQHFDQVLFVCPPWNPAVEDQAVGRAFRIGQKRPVVVWRFMMEGFHPDDPDDDSLSIDSYCDLVQQRKRELIASLISP
jgi:SNF2 family DNA or RNA helicase